MRWFKAVGIIIIILFVSGWQRCIEVCHHEFPRSILQFADNNFTPEMDKNVWIQITNTDNNLFEVYESDGLISIRDKVFFNKSGDIWGNIGITLDGKDKDDYEIALIHNATIIRKRSFQIPKDGGLGDKAFSFYVYGVKNGDSVYLGLRNIDNDNDPNLLDGYFDVFLMP